MRRWTGVAFAATMLWLLAGWAGARMGGAEVGLRASPAVEQDRPVGPAWLGLFSYTLLGEQPDSVDLSLGQAPHPDAPSLGVLRVLFHPESGLQAHWLPPGGGGAPVPLEPDLFDPDWGYGPWFHQTLLEDRNPWFLLPADPFPAPVWLDASPLGEEPPVLPVEPGMILESSRGSVVVLEVQPGALRVRPEQEADMWCDLPPDPPLLPWEAFLLQGRALHDANRHLRIRVKYTRGC